MKKQILILTIICFFAINCVSAYEESLNYSTSTNIQIKLLKYDPYPVNPGEYFDLWIEVNSLGGNPSEDIKFTLLPEYPFSLDSNEDPVRNIGKGSKTVVLDYKVRVSDDAVEGVNKLLLTYNVFGINYQYDFDIQVADAQTDFDLVIQESSGTDISLAIANTGKNTANSLIVRVPEQEGYKVSGTNGQMVGNLDSGDYTIVSFSLVQTSKGESQPLEVQMDYTDSIGKRRSVVKNVELTSSSPVANATQMIGSGNFPRGNFPGQSSGSIFSKVWFWAVVVLVLGLGFYIYKKQPAKLKDFFSQKNRPKQEKNSKAPDWVASDRVKR